MKAALYTAYGPPDVVQIAETEKPVPKDDEVLIKVLAASVNPYDWHFIRGEPYLIRLMAGLPKPKDQRLGSDVAGVIETVGGKVTQFKPGDEIFGSCRGAFAEYACTSESNVVSKPRNVSFEQAASVPIAAFTALQSLRLGGLVHDSPPGRTVLINGASGGVGTFAVQIAAAFGAEVTGVCSTGNLEMVQSIGAARVIDYTKEDFTKVSRRFDIFLDNVGNHSLSACKSLLNSNGTYIAAGGSTDLWMFRPMARMVAQLVLSWIGTQKMLGIFAKASQDDLTILHNLMQAGKLTPVIDKTYALSKLSDGIRYLEAGHARGKVVITVG